MRGLLFLCRVAFICNLFFIISAALQWKDFISVQPVFSTVVVIGYFMAVFIFNPIANIACAVQWLRRKALFETVPRWLVVANFIFLLMQILFIIFFLNDTLHY